MQPCGCHLKAEAENYPLKSFVWAKICSCDALAITKSLTAVFSLLKGSPVNRFAHKYLLAQRHENLLTSTIQECPSKCEMALPYWNRLATKEISGPRGQAAPFLSPKVFSVLFFLFSCCVSRDLPCANVSLTVSLGMPYHFIAAV